MTDTNRTPASSVRPRWLVLGTVLLGQFMLVLDATVVNVALPAIQGDLAAAGPARLTWITNAYMIAFGGLLLLFGRLGDQLGRRRIFLARPRRCSRSRRSRAGSRRRAGADRRALRPGHRRGGGVVGDPRDHRDRVPAPAERAKAMSGYMFVSVSGGSLGLFVGGLLTQALGWHWIF